MKEISIQTFAKIETSTDIFGTHVAPIMLIVKINNKSNHDIHLNDVYITVKRSFWFDKDLPAYPLNLTLRAKGTHELEYDIGPMAREYGENQIFTIKSTTNRGIFESDRVSLRAFAR